MTEASEDRRDGEVEDVGARGAAKGEELPATGRASDGATAQEEGIGTEAALLNASAATAEREAGDEDDERDDDAGPINIEERILCPDGACVGVIGASGRCNTCGTPMDEADRKAFESTLVRGATAQTPLAQTADGESIDESAASDDDGDNDAALAGGRGRKITHEGSDDPFDLSLRVLCSDGACVGLVGEDGKCKLCGTPYTGDPE